jgi:NAD(P)-dependent dehydrogenase (short-subunit alcohol dehydrogenase family)
VVHVLRSRLTSTASVLLFGGRAKDRPYPGSTTVSTVNGGVVGMVNTLATELAPVRVNAIHPGIVGDSPYWSARPPEVLEAVRARTPTGRTVTMSDVVGAAVFLLENRSVNGENLSVDGGWMLL